MENRHHELRDTSDPASGIDILRTSRRAFLTFGLGMIAAGCSELPKTVSSMPGPIWPDLPMPELPPGADVVLPVPAQHRYELPEGVLSRSSWAKGKFMPGLMNRMVPVRYITVHHDGMDPFYGNSRASAAERLEVIRRSHRNKGWGDIGYHFVIDRGGRVWEARHRYFQGAHVKDHNEGNLGVMAMGNFDLQMPTNAQFEGLGRHVKLLMQMYNVPARNIRTHQEWAVTACPGRQLQRHMDVVRDNHMFG